MELHEYAYVCRDHERNRQAGGCLSCTFNEMRRYEFLYHEALDALRDQQRARTALREAEINGTSLIYRADKGLDNILLRQGV